MIVTIGLWFAVPWQEFKYYWHAKWSHVVKAPFRFSPCHCRNLVSAKRDPRIDIQRRCILLLKSAIWFCCTRTAILQSPAYLFAMWSVFQAFAKWQAPNFDAVMLQKWADVCPVQVPIGGTVCLLTSDVFKQACNMAWSVLAAINVRWRRQQGLRWRVRTIYWKRFSWYWVSCHWKSFYCVRLKCLSSWPGLRLQGPSWICLCLSIPWSNCGLEGPMILCTIKHE